MFLNSFCYLLCILGIYLNFLLFNESVLHYLSAMCVTMMVFCVCVNDPVHLLYSCIYISACGKAVMNFDSSWGFPFYHLHWSVMVLSVAVNFFFTQSSTQYFFCKLQFYTVKSTVCSLDDFTVFFFYKIILATKLY